MPDNLIALDEAEGFTNECGAILQDIENSTYTLRTKLEELTQAIESMREPIEISTANNYAVEHDDDPDDLEEDDWPDDERPE